MSSPASSASPVDSYSALNGSQKSIKDFDITADMGQGAYALVKAARYHSDPSKVLSRSRGTVVRWLIPLARHSQIRNQAKNPGRLLDPPQGARYSSSRNSYPRLSQKA